MTRLVRPRTLIYLAIMAVIAAGVLIALSGRAKVDVNVLHDRNPLFVRLADGGIQNGYTIKILNKSHQQHLYDLTVAGIDGASFAVVGQSDDDGAAARLAARPDTVTTYRLLVSVPPGALEGDSQPLTLALADQDGGSVAEHRTVFRGPGS